MIACGTRKMRTAASSACSGSVRGLLTRITVSTLRRVLPVRKGVSFRREAAKPKIEKKKFEPLRAMPRTQSGWLLDPVLVLFDG
jgi:hypothetical protein